jgi:4-amino-4-deoxy-L-arabinose transferase-like glycosyltransferase
MPRVKLNLSAETALRVVLAGGFLLMLAANLPGHLSYDSVIELQEGRFHERLTWAPPFYSWVLGVFDALVPGTGLYVVGSGLVLCASLISLGTIRGRTSWIAVPLAVFIVMTPDLLIYQAIVWKDVFFANVAVAALVCLAHAARAWDDRTRRWLWLAGSLLLLAAAALTRQNGLIVGLLAAIALGWIAARGRWVRGVAWGASGFVAVIVATQLIGAVATPSRIAPGDGLDKGLRILRHYDLVGAAALDPTIQFPAIERTNPESGRQLRAHAKTYYSPERIDTLVPSQELTTALWSLSDEAVADAWTGLIIEHPGIYLKTRLAVFRWVFLTPVLDRCLPVFVGVEAPPDKLARLQMPGGRDVADNQLINYVTWFKDTPAYSHLSYAIVALIVAGALLVRREPMDIAVVALMLGALGFAASFLVISLACDYRYLYFLDVAAMAGLLYLAADPRLRRR